MTSQQSNPLNGKFWVEAEYGGRHIQNKAAQALTATYGAMGVAHLIERSIAEMNLARETEHEYSGLQPVLLENILCAQHVLLNVISKHVEELCEHHKEGQ
ncbi:hypothetical protein [Methylobacillus sp.]|uniref:hypothetical protein n=1 Tax=Methylobacillus sp. TaxID=56818 RepID=UPI002FE412AF